jgi:ABC-type polar amino acid transport system ATPase subunit
MKLEDLKKEIEKYQYFEDTTIIDVSLAAILATRLKIGDPVWMIIIGPSSGGKSQILRPLSLTDPKFLHRVDDLTARLQVELFQPVHMAGRRKGD